MEDITRIILDVDGGIDGALGVLFALKSNKAKLEGVTTGFGHVTAEQATMNMMQVLEFHRAGMDTSVFMGALKPLFREWERKTTDIQGTNGMADYILPATKSVMHQEHAADFMVRIVRENPGRITIVTAGSLTNVAIALSKDPDFVSQVKRLVIAGGALQVPGNVTPVAEKNIYYDPEAAHRVFESGIPITMVGLDVSMQVMLTEAHLTELSKLGRAVACPLKNPEGAVLQKRMMKFIEHVGNYLLTAYRQELDLLGIPLQAPLAVAAALDSSLVDIRQEYIQIETKGTLSAGATLADLRRRTPKRINTDVCVSVDVERFIQQFIEVFSSIEGEEV
ncbi:hypothetical protein BVG16_32255 [Paenibacillus selenitireducens]|uniref:Inosine/uridine-preferring nucleoside hydrolase domain-containing protein n=1 Tax=Paenibacillus selenitireducens TaxID=1324314 RepID=A0A1T2WYS7_9BACL|nr:nucleoside hydrolase [Paenibacillus selenitireducens]OPA72774.1 hypothetical protein BVG16_32255 [Paenibacillus selenitireducens]